MQGQQIRRMTYWPWQMARTAALEVEVLHPLKGLAEIAKGGRNMANEEIMPGYNG